MAYRSGLARHARGAVAAMLLAALAAPAPAQLFWSPPDFRGPPVTPGEPGMGQPMPGATVKEQEANLIWSLRAGLNVAALQCQFSPALMTVRNYNELLAHHAAEFAGAYQTITGYFKRTNPKGWQVALDQFTTRTYNGFSTLQGQLGFCNTASAIGAEALGRPKGSLMQTARTRLREFRNSLIFAGDRVFVWAPIPRYPLPRLEPECWDKKTDRLKAQCRTTAVASLSPSR